MSADDGKQVVMKGVTHGACDYLIKPIRIEELKNIWQHVVRKKKNEWKELEQSASVEDVGDRLHKQSEDADYSSSANEDGNWKGSKRRKDEEDELEERDDTSALKKPRVVWSVELHQQFVAAVNQLGIDSKNPLLRLHSINIRFCWQVKLGHFSFYGMWKLFRLLLVFTLENEELQETNS